MTTLYASNTIRELEKCNKELTERVKKLEANDDISLLSLFWAGLMGGCVYTIVSSRIHKERMKSNEVEGQNAPIGSQT